jgi:hypothetical protein
MTDRVLAARPVRLHYAWIVAGVAFVTLLLASGFRSAPGVLIDFASHQVGAAVAAFAAGVARSSLGTYSPAFVTAGWLCAAAAVLAYSVGRSRRRPLVPVVAEAAPLA